MPLDEDKYPKESGRRRFVKGVVGAASLSSVAAGGAAALDTATLEAGSGGGSTPYVGIENTAGPAPRAMPLVPLEVGDEDGILRGIWPEYDEELGLAVAEDFGGSGIAYSSAWYQYCGVQTRAGVAPQADQDNVLRTQPGNYEWQSDYEAGEPLREEMFDDYQEWGNGIGKSGVGKPAAATWRSEGDVQTIPVQVLRSERVQQVAEGTGRFSEIPESVRNLWSAATDAKFVAWLNKCTHFCCVPGFKLYAGSADFGAENEVYCQCHQSVYDPFSPVKKTFVALPRPPE